LAVTQSHLLALDQRLRPIKSISELLTFELLQQSHLLISGH
jgi:hypothetical protein